jgi:hypothetical protein
MWRIFGIVALCGLSLVRPALPADEKPLVAADMPGAIHNKLTALAGSWDVAVKYKLGDKEHTGKAACEARPILDGRFLYQVYKSNFAGKPFTVVQILGYDNHTKKSVEIMMDSMSTAVMHNQGTISEDGKVITNVGEHFDAQIGKMGRLKTVTTIGDADHFTLEWYRTGDDGKEDRVVTMSHRRKKPGDGKD